MVHFMENRIEMDDDWGYPYDLGNLQIFADRTHNLAFLSFVLWITYLVTISETLYRYVSIRFANGNDEW